MIKLKKNSQRGSNAKIALTVVLFSLVLVLVGEIFSLKVFSDLKAGVINMNQIEIHDIIVPITGLIYLVTYIIAIVLFIMWFRRAYYNLHQIYTRGLKHTEGWAAGAWFVPIMNLYAPYQIAKDLFTKSREVLDKNELIETNQFKSNSIGVWWTLWISASILGRIDYYMQKDLVNNLDLTGAYMSIVVSVVSIIACIMCIRVIKEYMAMEEILPNIGDGNVRLEGDFISDSELLDDTL